MPVFYREAGIAAPNHKKHDNHLVSLLFCPVYLNTCRTSNLYDFLRFHHGKFTQDLGLNTDYSNIKTEQIKPVQKTRLKFHNKSGKNL